MNQQTPNSSPTPSGSMLSGFAEDSSPSKQPAPTGSRLDEFPASAADGGEPLNQAPSQAQHKTQGAAHRKTASPSRCRHLFQSGRRCRRLVSPANPRFCSQHAKLPENLQPDDLTSELDVTLESLDALDGIYVFLAKLAILLAQNRVSTRRAAVLAYITNQLLRTFSAIRREEAAIQREEAANPPPLILDAPRPIRD